MNQKNFRTMLQGSKLGKAIIISVSGIVFVIFSAAALLEPGSIVISDGIIDFLSLFMENFLHQYERQIVEITFTQIA